MIETYLDLPDGKVEESHAFTDFDGRLGGTTHTHGSSKTTVELEHGDLKGKVNAYDHKSEPKTRTFSRMAASVVSGRDAYSTTCSAAGGWILSQTLTMIA